ncbi:hypothetical protein GCM10012320_07510 [Sinomonas cellulolyticus]|uniref:Uncharacterized protein n=1 Tax=Sinomonas cellulolyticus TaxID=2801916 RepID=A0ABS1K706_9MICC|nr:MULTISPECIES: hypothetical protein [Sinomonas]MBL0706076.1 hypothetical protein [Sinomonas cellulolyticus]GHG43364.1 hypothetical protein GCM10012320_07510 [Sinomonas sp. KCTC 49339]
MVHPEVPLVQASAHGGWQVRIAQPEPIPPEVLDLFAAGSFTLLEQYALTAPPDGGPGTVALSLPHLGAARRAVLVVLRESQCPDVVYASGTAAGGLAFRIVAGKHDDDARLLLLAVRSESAGPDPAVRKESP